MSQDPYLLGRLAVHYKLVTKDQLQEVLIREGNLPMLVTLMQSGKRDGMQLLDDALAELVQEGTISPREAHLEANDKARFEPMLERA